MASSVCNVHERWVSYAGQRTKLCVATLGTDKTLVNRSLLPITNENNFAQLSPAPLLITFGACVRSAPELPLPFSAVLKSMAKEC